MADLFGREIFLNIGGTAIRTKYVKNKLAPILKVAFKVVRSLKPEPNTADVAIYNLNKDNRAKFQTKELPTIIEAGYIDNASQIFNGDLTYSQNRLENRNWVTTLQAGDGSKQYRSARINTSVKGPVKIGDVLQLAAESMGLNLGNVQDKINEGSIRGALTEFTNGIVLSGKSEQQLNKIIKSMGFGWSIQDGQLQLLGPKEFIGVRPVLLSPGTGLIGTPEAGEKGFVRIKASIQPNLLPGYRVKVESKNKDVNGFFRIEKATFIGDTWGGDWYVDIEGKPL